MWRTGKPPAPYSDEPFGFWRCQGCGKLSYALRRPQFHRRFVSSDQDPPVYAIVLKDHRDASDPFGMQGWTLRCGPFVRWEARPLEDEPPPPRIRWQNPFKDVPIVRSR